MCRHGFYFYTSRPAKQTQDSRAPAVLCGEAKTHCNCPYMSWRLTSFLVLGQNKVSGVMSSLSTAGGRRTAPCTVAAAKAGASHAVGRSSHAHLHLDCSHLKRSQHVRRSLRKLQP